MCRRSLDTKPGTKVQLLGAIDVRNGCVLLKVCRMKKKKKKEKKGGLSVRLYVSVAWGQRQRLPHCQW
jgi:hypothetical protein